MVGVAIRDYNAEANFSSRDFGILQIQSWDPSIDPMIQGMGIFQRLQSLLKI